MEIAMLTNVPTDLKKKKKHLTFLTFCGDKKRKERK